MRSVSKCIIFLVALSFLFGRLGVPITVYAADKITKIEPQVTSTPEEDITVPEKPTYGKWLLLLGGVALAAALASGGGGGGGDGPSDEGGDVTVTW